MRKLLFISLSIISLSACQVKTDYQKWEEKELNSGVINDSIYLGISFGMSPKEFFAHCWELNKEGLIRQGPINNSVEYQLEGLEYPAKLNFYPTFHENEIIEMPATIYYSAWSPWNKTYYADSLQLDVINWLGETYGAEFMEITHPKRGTVQVSLSGNRRISVQKKDDQYVKVIFSDLRKKEHLFKPKLEKKG